MCNCTRRKNFMANERIKANMDLTEMLFTMSEGNPGALT